MELDFRIETNHSFSFIGSRSRMSLANDTTPQLWASFMPIRKLIEGVVDDNLYSIGVYPIDYFNTFNPAVEFDKWAALKVDSTTEPNGKFERLDVSAGDYLVFPYVGLAKDTPPVFQYIYGSWIPQSKFDLDDRPHLAVMPPGYDPNDPEAKEEFWVPIKPSQV